MAQRLGIMSRLLTYRKKSPICAGLQHLLALLTQRGLRAVPSRLREVLDPCVLGWLHEPQLLQKDEKEIGSYSLQVMTREAGRGATASLARAGLCSPPSALLRWAPLPGRSAPGQPSGRAAVLRRRS